MVIFFISKDNKIHCRIGPSEISQYLLNMVVYEDAPDQSQPQIPQKVKKCLKSQSIFVQRKYLYFRFSIIFLVTYLPISSMMKRYNIKITGQNNLLHVLMLFLLRVKSFEGHMQTFKPPSVSRARGPRRSSMKPFNTEQSPRLINSRKAGDYYIIHTGF